MILPLFTRRTLFGAAALLSPLLRTGAAVTPDPLLAAIRITEAADMAHRAAGLASALHRQADGRLTTEWRAYRVALAKERRAARLDLHALTPATQAGALALIGYYAARAERAGTRGAARTSRRYLREVFSRPDACQPGCSLPALMHHPPG